MQQYGPVIAAVLVVAILGAFVRLCIAVLDWEGEAVNGGKR